MTEKTNVIPVTKQLYDFLEQHKQNEKLTRTVEIGATFMLITFFMVFAIRPTAMAITSLLGEIQAKEAMSKELRTKINKVLLAQDAFTQVERRYSVIKSALPDNPYYTQALDQVLGSSQDSQVQLKPINFNLKEALSGDPNSPLDNTPRYSLSLSSSAGFTPLVDFLNKLVENRRPFIINSLSFSKDVENGLPQDSSKSSGLSVNFNMFTYFWPENEKK
ncbi:MAG TPA: hypothetical protein VF828_03045 [Patescibacteria group bacterium]